MFFLRRAGGAGGGGAGILLFSQDKIVYYKKKRLLLPRVEMNVSQIPYIKKYIVSFLREDVDPIRLRKIYP